MGRLMALDSGKTVTAAVNRGRLHGAALVLAIMALALIAHRLI